MATTLPATTLVKLVPRLMPYRHPCRVPPGADTMMLQLLVEDAEARTPVRPQRALVLPVLAQRIGRTTHTHLFRHCIPQHCV